MGLNTCQDTPGSSMLRIQYSQMWCLLLITVDKIFISIVSLINLNFFGLLQVRLMRSPLFLPPYVADVELVPSAGETL